MFVPKTARIDELAKKFPNRIAELEGIFANAINIYIDYANIRPWANKLGWHIEPKRLKQFLDSFDTVQSVKFYNGTLAGDADSETFMAEIKRYGFDVHTKPVKKMKLSIDISSIPSNSPDILKDFIRKPLLQKLNIETIEFLNGQLKDLNGQGILFLEDLKCNFDVEIGRDMLLDDKNGATNFFLWSGDSDFADPVQQLLGDGKKVVLFATARRVSSELNALTQKGLFIFDIQKIRDFICWKKEINA
jgi:uncharacterized LabA/DUF88 family protein